MSSFKDDKVKWVLTGLVFSLVVVVIILFILVLRMEKNLSSMLESQPKDMVAQVAQPDPAPAPHRKPKAGVDPGAKGNILPDLLEPGEWDPFVEMQRMRTDIDKLFSASFGRFGMSQKYRDLVRAPEFSPRIDVQENPDSYVVTVDLPGVKDGEIAVNVEGRNLTISGKRDGMVSAKDDKGKVVREELFSWSFSRTLTLPGDVDPKTMKAAHDNGVFTITLPKTATSE